MSLEETKTARECQGQHYFGGRVKIRNLSGALSLAGLNVYETCGVTEISLANIVKLEF